MTLHAVQHHMWEQDVVVADERADAVYDLSVLMLGAGLQSSALCEMMVEGAYPLPDLVIFADTGDEPQHVYDQVDYLRRRLAAEDVPLQIVTAGNLIEDTQKGNGRFAGMPLFVRDDKTGILSMLPRQCTNEYKIQPSVKYLRRFMAGRGLASQIKGGAYRVKRGVRVRHYLGISYDELERMKPSRTPWLDNAYPLVDLRMWRADCARWLREHGLPVPRKSSCRSCPFHDLDTLRAMRDENPEEFEHVCVFDDWLRSPEGRARFFRIRGTLYLSRYGLPLREAVDTSLAALPLFALCGGHCMV